MLRSKLRQLWRQHQVAKAFGGANAHRAVQALAYAGRGVLHRQKRRLHAFDLRQQAASGLAEPVPGRFARKQRRAHLLFQRLNAPRHRGVVHPQAARGAHQGAGAGQLQKIAQVVPVHCVAFEFGCVVRFCKLRAHDCLLC